MFEYIDRQKNRGYAWFSQKAQSAHVLGWLGLISFAESIIFPLPTAAFLLAIFMGGAKRWYFYALYTTVFSIIGGFAGYIIGYFFFDTLGVRIVDLYQLQSELREVQSLYNDNAFMVTLIGAFTPIPYKIFTLTAGFLKINLSAFIAASIIGRGLQFFIIAFVMKQFGDRATKLFLTYFNYLAVVGILLLLYLFLH